MHVVVDDGDARQTVGARMRRGDRDVVEQAEAHRAVPLRVMSRRPDHRERPPPGSVQDVLDASDRGPRGQQRDLI